MEQQKNLSKLPILNIPSLFDRPVNSNQKQSNKKKISNPLRFTMESSLDDFNVDSQEIFNEKDENTLKNTTENWIG